VLINARVWHFQVGEVITPLSTGMYASGGEFGPVQATKSQTLETSRMAEFFISQVA
jgi:hypothetical protein